MKKRGERVVGGVLAVALAGALVATNLNSLAVLASTGSDGWYYTDFNSFEEEQAYAKQYSIEMQAESIVLLKNNGVLPLSKAKNVTLFGNSSYYHVVGKNSGATGYQGFVVGAGAAQRDEIFSIRKKICKFPSHSLTFDFI